MDERDVDSEDRRCLRKLSRPVGDEVSRLRAEGLRSRGLGSSRLDDRRFSDSISQRGWFGLVEQETKMNNHWY